MPAGQTPCDLGETLSMLYGHRHPLLTEVERDAMRRAGHFNAQVLGLHPAPDPGRCRPPVRSTGSCTITRATTATSWPAWVTRAFLRAVARASTRWCATAFPSDERLREGDIVNLDITSIVDGWFGDQSETFVIGEASEEALRVTQAAFDCLYLGIHAITPGGRVADIGRAIVREAQNRGFSVVREYVGHGIGRRFHQDPSIPHYPNRQSYTEHISPGTCFTIEPMINVGSRHTLLDRRDGWTVRTRDRKLSAQFEHTILMTEDGPEILTTTRLGPQEGHRFLL